MHKVHFKIPVGIVVRGGKRQSIFSWDRSEGWEEAVEKKVEKVFSGLAAYGGTNSEVKIAFIIAQKEMM